MQDLFTQNHKTLLKEIKPKLSQWKDNPVQDQKTGRVPISHNLIMRAQQNLSENPEIFIEMDEL